MRIDFFEEFPEKNLEKARLVSFPSTIFLAAKSFEQFKKFKERLRKINSGVEAAYWPTVEGSYWISAFSRTEELLRITQELIDRKPKKALKVLIDLELPIKKREIFVNLPFFFKNRRLLKALFRGEGALNLKLYSAEYPDIGLGFLYKLLGISFGKRKIFMFYTSMLKHNFLFGLMKRRIRKAKQVGLGVLAEGVCNEPLLNKEGLIEDLQFCRGKNAVIYRLGGIDKEIVNEIKKFK